MKEYKKWLLTLPIYILMMGLALIFIINILIDPYEEYNLIITPFNKLKSVQSYETAPFRMYQYLNEDKYIIVFGTSHSATISEELVNSKLINLSLSTYGNPSDVYYFLKGLNLRQLKNIKKIYYLLDWHTLTDQNSIYSKINFNSTYDFLFYTVKNIDHEKLIRSFETVIKNLTKSNQTKILNNGVFVDIKEDKFIPDTPYATSAAKRIKFTYSDKSLEYLDKIDKLCKQNNIKIVYFKTVFSNLFLKKVVFNSLETHYRKILNTIDGLYSFIYMDNISNNLNYFSSDTHHKYSITKFQMIILQNDKLSPNYYVTKKNIDKFLKCLKNKIKSSKNDYYSGK